MSPKRGKNSFTSLSLLVFSIIVTINFLSSWKSLAENTPSRNIRLSRDHVSIFFIPPLQDEFCYEKTNLETMINMVSKIFGTITLHDAPLPPELYPLENITNNVVLAPIVAAEHNNRSIENESLKVMITFNLSLNENEEDGNSTTSNLSNFEIAKYYADLANGIYPGTVEILILTHSDHPNLLKEEDESMSSFRFRNEFRSMEKYITKSRATPNTADYKLGVTISLEFCENVVGQNETLLYRLITHLDLVIPVIYAKEFQYQELIPDEEHATQLELFRNCEKNLQQINPTVEIIPAVICNPPTSASILVISKYFQCWQLMSDWATEKNRKVILFQAFDRNGTGEGWWRLKNKSSRIVNEASFLENSQGDVYPTTIRTDGLNGVFFDHRVRSQFLSRVTPYSEKEVRAMLEIVSSRFSTVIPTQLPFIVDSHSSAKNVKWIPHLAAKLNKEIQKDNATSLKQLSIIIPFYQPHNHSWIPNLTSNNSLLNLQVALEVAQSTNKIFPGTVSTLVYDGLRGHDFAENAFYLKHLLGSGLGKKCLEKGYRLGTIIDLVSCQKSVMAFYPVALWSKLIIIDISRPGEPSSYPDIELRKNLEDGGKCMRAFKDTFHQVEVMFAVNCTAILADNSTFAVNDLAMCVHMVSKWGKENKVHIIISQAFDIPSGSLNSAADPNGGWWKLKQKFKMRIAKDSFEEKLLDYIDVEQEEPDNFAQPVEPQPFEESTTFIIVIASVTGFLLLLVAVFVQTIRLTRKQSLLSRLEMSEFFDGTSPSPTQTTLTRRSTIEKKDGGGDESDFMNIKYDAKRFEIRKQEFQFGDSTNTILGKGNFGVVQKLKVTRFPVDVAVKVPLPGCSKQTLKSLLSEIKIMSFVGDNENVVRFMGAYTKEIQNGMVYIVTELCEKGSLQSHLLELGKTSVENKSSNLNELIRFCREIATGMKFIGEKGVIHGDLSTRNVLLDSNATCKISDFGLSKKLYQYQVYTKTQREELPWRWLAIETLKRMEFSTKSDVWAYGVTVWEIFSFGDVPYPGQGWDWDFVERLEGGLRMKQPEITPLPIYTKILECWNNEPGQRPLFDDLMRFFRTPNVNEYLYT